MKLEIYTYSKCRQNKQIHDNIGGWSACMKYGSNETSFNGNSKYVDENKMELIAVIESLNRLKSTRKETVVFCKSDYIVNGINRWIYNWIANGWTKLDNNRLENNDLWKELYSLKQRFDKIEFVKMNYNEHNIEVLEKLCDKSINELEDLLYLDSMYLLNKDGTVK